ncbi:Cys-tRNA(Pro) deacylase, partial [bacterium]|nr:Cys-tRNA(Pro) deacylase [candidate division CSSED10-310 bacterium]
MSVTAAMRFLQQKKVPFEVREYDHRIKGAEYAAEALQWPLPAMVKTLVLALSGNGYVLCCMPGDRELSLKNLA